MTSKRKRRRGATVLEMSLVLIVFVWLTFGMLDVGICLFRYHVLSNVAQQAGRRAIVHGSLASVEGAWGPTTINVSASSITSIGVTYVDPTWNAIPNLLVGCDLSQTTINIQWLDGGNAAGQRVRATVTSSYTPFMELGSWSLLPQTLTAAATMPIAH